MEIKAVKLFRVVYCTAMGIVVGEMKLTKDELKEVRKIAKMFYWREIKVKKLAFEK